MATVNLGSIKFKWKGTYSGATAYTVDDVVEYNGSSYICILASTGNLPTNATYFEQMSSAGTNGTNGTDLTTTLTTQGDLVYRDGSGLQRLGAGTAGQVLQTGGAGANPSWVTSSGGILQFKQVVKTSKFHRTSGQGTFVNVPDLAGITITPSNASNKILINVTGTGGVYSSDRLHIKLVGTTSIAIGDDITGTEATTSITPRNSDEWANLPFSINFFRKFLMCLVLPSFSLF